MLQLEKTKKPTKQQQKNQPNQPNKNQQHFTQALQCSVYNCIKEEYHSS